ncbi:MAG: FAD-dependent 5-carboxymethylaminomethyl-2-thiouridine(34) oxidoreductase MnmC [Marinagarivorans sp.]
MEPDAASCARLMWDANGEPLSEQFGDVYFAKEHGLDESRYVFIAQNNLPQRFAELAADETFIIGETGFGTGLNFLATLECWQQHASPSAYLHFISVERYPLNHEDLRRALALWPQLSTQAQALLAAYPPVLSHSPNQGYFRLSLPGNVQLTLIFADATEAFNQFKPQYLGATLMPLQQHLSLGTQAWAVDAWFLDGFAPSKNPSMWQADLFRALANLSKPGTTLATFTAAAVVKQGLQAAGFAWQKQRGFGRKRDMLTAVCLPFSRYFPSKLKRPTANHAHAHQHNNWHITQAKPVKGKRVLVIGGGMAGCHSAFALAARGFNVTLAEAKTLAAGGSGNAQGIVYATLSHTTGPFADFNLAAFLFACSFYQQHNLFAQTGVLDLFSAAELIAPIAERFEGNPHWVMPVDAAQASSLASVPIEWSALFYPRAGWLNPHELCRQLSAHPNINRLALTPITELKFEHTTWHTDLGAFDQVIIAAAQECVQFDSTQAIKIKAIRGQVTAVKATSNLNCVVCGDGYIAPAQDQLMHTGATFNPKSSSLDILPADQAVNLANAARLSPAFAQLQPVSDRAGLRCVTPDYLPIVGPLPQPEFLNQFAAYNTNRWAYVDTPAAFYPQLWILTGLGSRGLTYSPLAAQILSSLILAEPLPISTELFKFIHPARFWVRDLIRGVLPLK